MYDICLSSDEFISKSEYQYKQFTIEISRFYNPYYDLSIGNYNFSEFCDEPIVRLNTILHNQSNNEQNYKIAKIIIG